MQTLELMRGAGRSRHILIMLLSSGYCIHVCSMDYIRQNQSSDPESSLMCVTSHDHLFLRVTVNRVGSQAASVKASLTRRRQKSALWRSPVVVLLFGEPSRQHAEPPPRQMRTIHAGGHLFLCFAAAVPTIENVDGPMPRANKRLAPFSDVDNPWCAKGNGPYIKHRRAG
jgi:hypothetical protein